MHHPPHLVSSGGGERPDRVVAPVERPVHAARHKLPGKDAEVTVELKLEDKGDKVADVGSVGGDVVLGAGVKVHLRARDGRRQALRRGESTNLSALKQPRKKETNWLMNTKTKGAK
jgi:hypothetical protein